MARIWLHACFEFARSEGIDAPYVDALHAFAYPNPRGGPPPPPEPRWDDGFAALEQELCPALLDEPGPRSELVDDLSGEVDAAQAAVFARRVASVERQLVALADATGRLLRVGLRQRLRGILAAPRPRALRVRALADFYYSFAGRWLHARTHAGTRIDVCDAAATLRWDPVFAGGTLAVLDGTFARGPVHANLLRIDPDKVRARVLDCRAALHRPFAEYVASLGALAAISGGFFLYSEPDIDPPSRRYDPVGLLVSGGTVLSPPTFPRGALAFGRGGEVLIGRCALEGARIASGNTSFRIDTLVTRASAEVGPDVPSVAIVDDVVVGVGRQLPVPLNGYVIPADLGCPVGARIAYAPPSIDGVQVREGVAGGPMLLEQGRVAIDLEREGFWGTAPPRTFSQDETGDRNTLPRLAAGIDGHGRLVVAAIDGRNFERALGMTLADVAELMAAVGCVTATNLDGGSSKRMVLGGRTLDLASTEVDRGTPDHGQVRPVHTAVVFLPA